MIEEGLVKPAGLAAFKRRKEKNSRVYSYENALDTLALELEAAFKQHPKAWTNFQAMAPYYRKAVTQWVMSAKREETRRRRLGILIESSEEGLKIPAMRGNKK